MNGFIKKLDSDETGGKCCCCVKPTPVRDQGKQEGEISGGPVIASGGEKRFS